MVKLIIFFRQPADVETFETHFAERHVPLIAAMSNIYRSAVSRALGAPRGEPLFYLIHEVYFPDLPALTYALNSPEGRAAGTDLLAFARDIVTLMFAEVWGEDPFESSVGKEPVPADQTPTQTPDSNSAVVVESEPQKVPIDVSFLEKEPTEAPIPNPESQIPTPAPAPSDTPAPADPEPSPPQPVLGETTE